MIRLHQTGEDGRRRPILVGLGAVAAIPRLWRPEWRTAVLVGDRTVMRLHGGSVGAILERCAAAVRRIAFPPGERRKTRETKEAIEDALLGAPIDRATCLVALGGGVTLDLAGFVAATCLRGIPHLNVPTSLLAQVDAATGGKVGVDVPAGKNLVGTFRFPEAVVIDPAFLRTLPARTWGSGLAELVKHAAIGDRALFGRLERRAAALRVPGSVGAATLARALRVKLAVVERDPFERGERRVLNFGHTIGHAIEAATAHRVDHGRAVAVGMAVEADAAVREVGFPAAERDRLRALLRELGLPIAARVPFEALVPFLAADKKNARGAVRCAMPERIGRMTEAGGEWATGVSIEALRDAWEAGRSRGA
jgi:3-dehydroquinate synthase